MAFSARPHPMPPIPQPQMPAGPPPGAPQQNPTAQQGPQQMTQNGLAPPAMTPQPNPSQGMPDPSPMGMPQQDPITAMMQQFRQMQGMYGAQRPAGSGDIGATLQALMGAGRNGDTMLAHIRPDEARRADSINPVTKLPEFYDGGEGGSGPGSQGGDGTGGGQDAGGMGIGGADTGDAGSGGGGTIGVNPDGSISVGLAAIDKAPGIEAADDKAAWDSASRDTSSAPTYGGMGPEAAALAGLSGAFKSATEMAEKFNNSILGKLSPLSQYVAVDDETGMPARHSALSVSPVSMAVGMVNPALGLASKGLGKLTGGLPGDFTADLGPVTSGDSSPGAPGRTGGNDNGGDYGSGVDASTGAPAAPAAAVADNAPMVSDILAKLFGGGAVAPSSRTPGYTPFGGYGGAPQTSLAMLQARQQPGGSIPAQLAPLFGLMR